ncbi:aspartic peptidase domain-containing protein, partial [Cadophora sp. MPI-SDFR-AT-0126]
MKISLPITLSLQVSSLNISHARQRNLQQHPLQPPPRQTSIIPQEDHLSPVIRGWGNFMHTTKISLGTPPQSFHALLDLASSVLLVPAVNHSNTPSSALNPRRQYNSTSSSTFRPNGTAITSRFLEEDVSGYLSYDYLHISSLTLSDTLFQEAPTWQPFPECWLCDRPVDAVLPLGPYNATASQNFMSPIAQLIKAKILDSNIFSLRLSRNPGDGDGQLVLGGIVDEEFYTGDFRTIPMTSLPVPKSPNLYGFSEGDVWKTTISSLTVGLDSIKHAFSAPIVAIIDVGFPSIGLPVSLAEDINEVLGTDNWGPFAWADCEKRNTFPNVTIVLHDEEFILTPYDYLLEQKFKDDGDRLFCQSAFWTMFEDEGEDGGKDERVVVLGSAFVKAWLQERNMVLLAMIQTVANDRG